MSRSIPERGDIWLADLEPARAGEQGGTRPVVVVSSPAFNAWPVGLVVVVPVTSRERGFAHHVPVAGGGLDRPSSAMPEHVRSTTQRRLRRQLGTTDAQTLASIDDWLRRITGL